MALSGSSANARPRCPPRLRRRRGTRTPRTARAKSGAPTNKATTNPRSNAQLPNATRRPRSPLRPPPNSLPSWTTKTSVNPSKANSRAHQRRTPATSTTAAARTRTPGANPARDTPNPAAPTTNAPASSRVTSRSPCAGGLDFDRWIGHGGRTLPGARHRQLNRDHRLKELHWHIHDQGQYRRAERRSPARRPGSKRSSEADQPVAGTSGGARRQARRRRLAWAAGYPQALAPEGHAQRLDLIVFVRPVHKRALTRSTPHGLVPAPAGPAAAASAGSNPRCFMNSS